MQLTQTPEQLIRPFLLYSGLVFTIIRRAVLLGILLLFIHLFVVTIVPVRGASMDPTLADGTYILVDQLTPRFRPLTRGEIVAFRYPVDPKQKFIKRIISLPHETVLIRGGFVSFQRPQDKTPIRLREPYLPLGTPTAGDVSRLLGPDDYWVMGDNRTVSLDSRMFDTISKDKILGRAWLALWPPGEVRLISHFDPTEISE